MDSHTRPQPKDIAQLVVGAFALGFPVAMGDEVISLSESLSGTDMILLAAFSVLFVGAFVYYHDKHAGTLGTRAQFGEHVAIVYVVTLLCCALSLALVDALPLFEDPGIALKRTVLVGFPASFAATVVDSLS